MSLIGKKFPGAWAQELVFSADGAVLYGGGGQFTPRESHGWLWAWETRTGRHIWRTRVEGMVQHLSLLPDGEILLASGSGHAALVDARTGEARGRLVGEGDEATDRVAITPDGGRVLGGFREGVRVWDSRTGELLDLWKLRDEVSGWYDADTKRQGASFLQLWDGCTGALLHYFGEGFFCGAISGDGRRLAVGTPTAGPYRSIGKILLQDTGDRVSW